MSIKPTTHVLIVDDDHRIRAMLARFLTDHGLKVSQAGDGRAMFSVCETARIDVIVLDIMMPGEDGLSLCRRMRGQSSVPIILLTAMSGDTDRIIGLEIGADDYVVKPFSPREVAARVRAILKRVGPGVAPALFQVDLERMQITYRGLALSLTRHEFRLLQSLLEQPERVFSREQLLDAVGVPADAGYERNIDSHIKSLRSKLRSVAAQAEPIQTHRGLGYSYSPSHS